MPDKSLFPAADWTLARTPSQLLCVKPGKKSCSIPRRSISSVRLNIPGVILTVRREHLRTHAGQIAFPGGRLDPGEDPVAAAQREAGEEILLDAKAVDIVGQIEQYRTVTGFIVTPVIGVIPPDLPLEPHEHEVADWFEAPLDFLLDRANQHERTALFRGRTRHYYEIVWNEHRIWGVTAAIIVNLSRRLQWS